MAKRKTKQTRRRNNVAHLAMKKEPKLAVLPVQTQDDRYFMTPGEASNVKIDRAADGGYQREVSEKRVLDILADLEDKKAKGRKSNYPEIEIALVNGVMYCIDGQHRLAAHVRAGMEMPVHVRSMTAGEAHDLFVRNNSKAKPLRRPEIMYATRAKVGQQMRALVKTYGVTMPQAMAVATGVNGGRPVSLDGDGLTGPEEHVCGVILQIWTKDPRFVPVDMTKGGGSFGDKKNGGTTRTKFRKSIEWSFSSTTTLWALGRIAFDSMNNVSKLKKDIRIIQEADWNLSRLHNSLRALARNGAEKKALYEFMQKSVLLPAYRAGEHLV